jgi:hypothetical protein
MNYSGSSPYAMAKREREQLADYEEARSAFEYLLDVSHLTDSMGESSVDELAAWFGNGGVTDYAPIFRALVVARDAGVEEAKALLEAWADSYAKDRT